MTAIDSPSKTLLTPQTLKQWSVEDYHKLSEFGLLAPDERTELISGQIVIMAAKGTLHVIALQLLALQLDDFLRNQPYLVRTQDPIQLDDSSEPEPDLVVVKGDILTYANHHPYPEDVQLVVEIADTTLQQDCEVKDKLYAEANIAEYWVVDLRNRQLHIFQQPTPAGYDSHLILREGNPVSPLAFPDLTLAIASILPPVTPPNS